MSWRLAADAVNDRWRIADLAGLQRPPQFVAGILVESDNGAVRAADEADEPFSIEQGVRGITPHGRFLSEVFEEVALPNHLAIARVQTEQVTHRAEREDAPARDQRRGARAGGIADAIHAIVSVFPDSRTTAGVEAEDTLVAWNDGQGAFTGLPFGRLALPTVEQEQPVTHDGGAAVAALHVSAPYHERPVGGQRLDNAGLAPNAVTLRPHPLRQIIGARCRDGEKQSQTEPAGERKAGYKFAYNDLVSLSARKTFATRLRAPRRLRPIYVAR